MSSGVAAASGWPVQPLPAGLLGGELDGISCASTRACIAVGTGLVLRWDGLSWSIDSIPTFRGTEPWLADVSCGSARDCVAVGVAPPETSSDRWKFVAERWDGRRWSVRLMRNRSDRSVVPGNLRAVSCVRSGACTAVGYIPGREQRPLVERWEGGRWSIQPTPRVGQQAYLMGVSCVSRRSCIAVGHIDREPTHTEPTGGTGALVERWNGRRWAVQRFPQTRFSGLSAISCTSSRACVAVGGDSAGPMAGRWNGTSWSIQRLRAAPAQDFTDLVSVSCSSSTVCTAVGSVAEPTGEAGRLVERWTGGRWSIQQLVRHEHTGMAGRTLNDVSCPSRTSCMAVGSAWHYGDYVPLIERWTAAPVG